MPSQEFQRLLDQWHHKVIGLRHVSASLKTLVDRGFITRDLQYPHYAGGVIMKSPPIYSIPLKGAMELFIMYVEGYRSNPELGHKTALMIQAPNRKRGLL